MAHGSVGYTDVHELLEQLAWRRRRLALIAAAAVATAGAAPSSASAAVTSSIGGSPPRLTVVLTGGDDVTITCDSGTDNVEVNGADPGTGAAGCDSFEEIEVTGDGGANTIDLTGDESFETFDNLESVTLTGGAGTDSILGGHTPGTLTGGAGNDTLDGGDQLTLVETFDANMTLTNTSLVAGAETDSLSNLDISAFLTGGAGPNTIDMSGFDGFGATIDGAGGDDSLIAGKGFSGSDTTITGGTGNDTIDGDQDDELRESRDANMTLTDTSLTIGGEIDTLLDDLGGATLTGGAGANNIQTQAFSFSSLAGHDTSLEGGGGNDTLIGGSTHDLTGEGGNDSLQSGGSPFSSDVIERGDVNFTLTGGALPTLTGNGTDTLNGISSVGLTGGPSANTLDASAATIQTTLSGGDGGDTLRGGSDTDLFPEEIGSNDSIVGGNGTDTLGQEGINFGGPGYGSFTLTNTTLTRLDAAEVDAVSGMEFVGFSSNGGDETVDASGFDGAMEYRSGDGDDSIKGADGFREGIGADDIIWGGTGEDTIDGFDGGDLLEGNGPASMVQDGPNSTIAGGEGFDTIVGESAIDALLDGGPGQDEVEDGAEGSVTVTNSAITSTGDGTQPIANAEVVQVNGGAGADSINASAFDPTNGAFNFFFGTILNGSGGNDTLRGSRGQDQIDGGNDTDRLIASRDFNLILTASSLDGDDFFAGGSTDTLTSIDEASLTGGAGANQLTATSFGRPVTLRGAGGDDTLRGGSDDDSLEGDGGVDQYFANAGDDLLRTQDSVAESVIDCGTGTNTVFSDPADVLNANCGGTTPTVPGGGGNQTVPGGGGGGGGNATVPGGAGPLILNGCLNTDAGLSGKKLGPAMLGRKKSAQRAIFKGAKPSSRPGIDRYCATGGGNFRIGYPTKRLKPSRALLKKINGRVILILTSSRRFSISGIKPGDNLSVAKARLKGERRVKVGKNVWLVAGGSSSRLIVKVRGTKVGEVGIGDKRLGKNLKTLKRFLRAWQL